MPDFCTDVIVDWKDERQILARTLWGEGRSRGQPGMRVVASVIQNRVRHPCDSWGSGWVGVCLHWRQFSCWNSDDPNCSLIENVDESDPEFRLALGIAGETLQGKLRDVTGGANYYLTAGARRPPFLRHARFLGRKYGFDCYHMRLGG